MKWDKPNMKMLVKAILSLETQKEAQDFMRDLMTEGEIEEFSRRLRAAQMLSQKIPYSNIEKETGLSSTTVARVSKWLNSGQRGYKTILDRLHHNNST